MRYMYSRSGSHLVLTDLQKLHGSKFQVILMTETITIVYARTMVDGQYKFHLLKHGDRPLVMRWYGRYCENLALSGYGAEIKNIFTLTSDKWDPMQLNRICHSDTALEAYLVQEQLAECEGPHFDATKPDSTFVAFVVPKSDEIH